jgi:lipopolysaccharide/colanic/teichoic acid biosynthesis glycosyltransferase
MAIAIAMDTMAINSSFEAKPHNSTVWYCLLNKCRGKQLMREFEKMYDAAGVSIEQKPVYDFFKRAFDIVFSIIGLVVLSPTLLIIALVIKLYDNGPVIYASDRVGKKGKVFRFYKFRSMCVNADEIYNELVANNETGGLTFKMKDDPRITGIGKFLRQTSLDELPQLFNILKGDMSFVGPRPPLKREVKEYTQTELERLSVLGGLTCYWQISGRSSVDFDTMIMLDRKYINDRSFWTDIKMIFLTIPAVIKGEGAY